MRPGCVLLLFLAACAETEPPSAPAKQVARLEIPAEAPLVAFLGDSLSAGIHLAEDESFPNRLQQELYERGAKFRLVNAGVSGDTTAGGLRRIDWLLGQKPKIVVVELGGNDGLRGIALENVRANLNGILDKIDAAGATPLLLGVRIPPNYGPEYTENFARLYDEIAAERDIAYVPFFMEPVAGKSEYFLEDALHPNTEGHRLIAEKVLPALQALLR